jgi:hypothetical protein
MDEQFKIPSKEEVHARLRKHLETTLEYLAKIEEEGENIDYGLPIGNWFVHDVVSNYPQVATYFPKDLAQRSASLWKEWVGLINFCERRAYYDDPEVQQRSFPWFEGMELSENLRKTLTIDQMVEFGTKGTYLGDWVYDRINIAAMTEVAHRVQHSRLYDRKKVLEEAMIVHLETPEPPSK